MKQIQQVVFPLNLGTATLFNMISVDDNLSTNATFLYQLFNEKNIQIQYGNLTMSGADYTAYSSSPDSNNYAYNWGATKLGLTLL